MRKRKKAPGLTPPEVERLALLSEELGEAQQAVGKILRHGYTNRHPESYVPNRETLVLELGDVLAAMRIMDENGDVVFRKIQELSDEKIARVGEYLHHKHKYPPLYDRRCGHSAQSWTMVGARRAHCDDCESDIVRLDDGYWYTVVK